MTEICVQDTALIVIIGITMLCGLVIGAICTVCVLNIERNESRRA